MPLSPSANLSALSAILDKKMDETQKQGVMIVYQDRIFISKFVGTFLIKKNRRNVHIGCRGMVSCFSALLSKRGCFSHCASKLQQSHTARMLQEHAGYIDAFILTLIKLNQSFDLPDFFVVFKSPRETFDMRQGTSTVFFFLSLGFLSFFIRGWRRRMEWDEGCRSPRADGDGWSVKGRKGGKASTLSRIVGTVEPPYGMCASNLQDWEISSILLVSLSKMVIFFLTCTRCSSEMFVPDRSLHYLEVLL